MRPVGLSQRLLTDHTGRLAPTPLAPHHNIYMVAEKKFRSTMDKDDLSSDYDVFRESDRDMEGDNRLQDTVLGVLRFFIYVIITCTVLFGGVGSSIAVLNMATGIEQDNGQCSLSRVAKLMIIFTVPLVIEWLSTVVRLLFSRNDWPSGRELIPITLVTLLTASGKSIFVFKILPGRNIQMAAILSMTVFITPSILNIFNTIHLTCKRGRRCFGCVQVSLSILAAAIQLGATTAVTALNSSISRSGRNATISAMYDIFTFSHFNLYNLVYPASVLFISIQWWENYITSERRTRFRGIRISTCIRRMNRVRHTSRIFMIPIEASVFFFSAFIPVLSPADNLNVKSLGSTISNDLVRSFNIIFERTETNLWENGESQLFVIMFVIISASFLVPYMFSMACKLHMQKLAFSIPASISPAVVYILIDSQCYFNFLQNNVLVNSSSCGDLSIGNTAMYYRLVAAALWVSFCVITIHIWRSRSERMASTNRLFFTPIMDPVFTSMNIALRRKQDIHTALQQQEITPNHSRVKKDKTLSDSGKDVPMLYVCATMWHETAEEMKLLVKSLLRLDSRVNAGRNAKKTFGTRLDPTDIYDLELHVIFDDAYVTDEASNKRVANEWVQQLMQVIQSVSRTVDRTSSYLSTCANYRTPYGGRLVYQLRGGTKLEIHLKDSENIRRRKRWSQVMYMYYLLAYKLMGNKNNASQESQQQFRRIRPFVSLLNHLPSDVVNKANNTYILTLDGDVHFQPDAVKVLMDRLRKNTKVGAVCGRIHPTGTGPVVWYQQFEYAAGHWLQKAAEHVLGCVLCCPGCFSMFRASALMDDNVLRTYTTQASVTRHYIQYEQGEDRWLCTLLLQQGYKLDYAAAADAYTHCPETFKDFFIQRRRWVPSALANTVDLLSSWRMAVQMNDNISRAFIVYQFLVLISSFLGMGATILVVLESYSLVLGISLWMSFWLSVLPVGFFIMVCLFVESQKWQIKIAAVLSSGYTVVMVVVSMGTLLSVIKYPFLSANVIFIIFLASVLILSAVAHPNEFFCLLNGVIYFFTIPISFVFLPVYSFCNMNIVSWGTRENVDNDKEQQTPFSRASVISFFRSYLFVYIERIFMKSPTSGGEVASAATTDEDILSGETDGCDKNTYVTLKDKIPLPGCIEADSGCRKVDTQNNKKRLFNDEKIISLEGREHDFWVDVLKRFLFPIKEDTKTRLQINEDLASTRNDVVFGFSLINLIFILAIIEIEIHREDLERIYIAGQHEPLSLVYLFLFALIILIQFLAMFVHRWGTFLHLISMAKVPVCGNNFDEFEIGRMAIREAEKLQSTDFLDDEPPIDYSDDEDNGVDKTRRRDVDNIVCVKNDSDGYVSPLSYSVSFQTEYDRTFFRNYRSTRERVFRRRQPVRNQYVYRDSQHSDTMRSLYRRILRYSNWPVHHGRHEYIKE